MEGQQQFDVARPAPLGRGAGMWLRAGGAWAAAVVMACAGATGAAMAADAIGAASTATGAPGDAEAAKITMSVRADHTAVKPGQTFLMGVTLTIEEGWHTYWDGLNDTGDPPKFRFEAPTGWLIEAMELPVPKRYVAELSGLDYVYEGAPTFFFRVRVPSDARKGDAKLDVRASWLVCKDVCIAERGEKTLQVEVLDEWEAPRRNIEVTKAMLPKLAVLPQPFASLREARKAEGAGEPTIDAIDGVLTIRVPGALSVEFVPDARSTAPADRLEGVRAKGEELRVTLASPAEAAKDSDAALAPLRRLGGLVRVEVRDGTLATAAEPASPDGVRVRHYRFETVEVRSDSAGAAEGGG